MPRVNVDPSTVQAGIPVLDDGDYEVTIGERKPFARRNEDGNEIYGVLFPLNVAMNDGTTVRIPHSLYMHNKDSLGFVKQFLMAALGFSPQDRAAEAEFNAQFADQIWIDYEYEGDTGKVNDVGPIFEAVQGQLVKATAKIVSNKRTGDPQNQFTWRTAS